MRATELAGRFPVAGVGFAETAQGLVKATVSHGGATGELFLQGAQVTAWQPAGQRPVIFTSPHSLYAPGKAIRGGIPVVFPWFGPHPTDPKAPQHGFARTAEWQLDGVAEEGGRIVFTLTLRPAGFALAYRVAFGADLRLDLAVRNTGSQPVDFEEALHSYFAVSDVERVSVAGLEQCGFIDKTANMAQRPALGAPLTLTGETDRVYGGTPDALAIDDPAWQRRIAIDKSGAASTIVWNPWPEKAAAMADLGADSWHGMLCVETGNVGADRVRLAAGAEHRMTTRVSLHAG